jgi:Uma2 family endonuclease
MGLHTEPDPSALRFAIENISLAIAERCAVSTAVAQRRLSVEEYLERDADLDQGRYEYLDGRVWLLAGATPEHNLVKDGIQGEIYAELRPRGCRSFTSDQRVKISDTRYVYPDVVVLCGTPEYTDESPPSLVNPELLVEVTSESTSDRDHQAKLDAYLNLDSLQEYWIASPSTPIITQYVRRGDEWIVRSRKGRDATLPCEALDLKISLDAIYALVETEEDAPDPESSPNDA